MKTRARVACRAINHDEAMMRLEAQARAYFGSEAEFVLVDVCADPEATDNLYRVTLWAVSATAVLA